MRRLMRQLALKALYGAFGLLVFTFVAIIILVLVDIRVALDFMSYAPTIAMILLGIMGVSLLVIGVTKPKP